MTVDERVEELLNNDEVLEKMLYAESPDKLMQVFEENNIVLEQVTKEEAFDAFQRAKNGELNEEDLDNVSGGVYFALKAGACYLAVSGSVAGALCVVGGVAVIGLASYAGYRLIKKYV